MLKWDEMNITEVVIDDDVEGEVDEFGCTDLLDEDGRSHSGELLTVEEYVDMCEDNALIDYDGMGSYVKDGVVFGDGFTYPSEYGNIPEDVTHILWYNN